MVKGFFSLPMIGGAALLAVFAVGAIALKVQSARLASEKEEHAATKAAFSGFKAEVERLGKEAREKVEAEKKRQADVNRKASESYEKRIAAVTDVYRRLRDQRVSPGASPVPPLPAAPIATASSADSDQLLSVLEAADRQTQQLIELQEWVKSQK